MPRFALAPIADFVLRGLADKLPRTGPYPPASESGRGRLDPPVPQLVLIRRITARGRDGGLRTGVLVLAAFLAGCAAPAGVDSGAARSKLARVGLELLSEDEAGVPPAEAGRFVPCRVVPGFMRPALPEHPAGYLIVGVGGRSAARAEEILRVLSGWEPGEAISVTARRNPYLSAEADWWEAEARLVLPREPAPPAAAAPPRLKARPGVSR